MSETGDPFLSAAELGISEEERAALIAAIEVLNAEAVVFDMSAVCFPVWRKSGRPEYDVPPCGTSCCIGGTVSLLMQNGMKLPDTVSLHMAMRADEYVDRVGAARWREDVAAPLGELYFDGLHVKDPHRGVEAIRLFLRGDRTPWQTIERGSDRSRFYRPRGEPQS